VLDVCRFPHKFRSRSTPTGVASALACSAQTPLSDKHFELLSPLCRLGMPHLFFPLRYVVFLKSIGIAAGIRADLVLELPPDRYPAAAQPFIAAITDPTVARVVQLFGPRVCGWLRYCAFVVAVCSSVRICLCELHLSLIFLSLFVSRVRQLA
jgi:hypothetical protein